MNKLLLSTTLIAVSFCSYAQTASKTFAITGKTNNNFFWADIKQVDLANGKVNKVLFETGTTPFSITSLDKAPQARQSTQQETPTGFGVAAAAFDASHNRLYFATMHFADIRYLDLNKPTASFTTIKSNILKGQPDGYQPEENHLTRMVIGADGYGYAISNDANHLIRFTTASKPAIEDLGNLVDASSNTGISIHNKCASWGGDVVADAFGKLLIVSANHNVFIVDPATRIATFKGAITGLPVNFTTNGAAVNDDGELVVSSANVFEGLYKLNMKDLTAVKIVSQEQPFNASDLANGNLLYQKEASQLSHAELPRITAPGDAKVYPNPVTANQFNVLFEDKPAGKYTILFTDLAGRTLQSKVVSIGKAGKVEAVKINGKVARGMYFVKVLDSNKQVALSEKIVVQ